VFCVNSLIEERLPERPEKDNERREASTKSMPEIMTDYYARYFPDTLIIASNFPLHFASAIVREHRRKSPFACHPRSRQFIIMMKSEDELNCA
jgi:hypothetical protein